MSLTLLKIQKRTLIGLWGDIISSIRIYGQRMTYKTPGFRRCALRLAVNVTDVSIL